jgi:hypothetical protein
MVVEIRMRRTNDDQWDAEADFPDAVVTMESRDHAIDWIIGISYQVVAQWPKPPRSMSFRVKG